MKYFWPVFLKCDNSGLCNFLKVKVKVQYCAGGKIEKNEVGGACGAYGGGERCAQGYSGETRGKEAIGETQT